MALMFLLASSGKMLSAPQATGPPPKIPERCAALNNHAPLHAHTGCEFEPEISRLNYKSHFKLRLWVGDMGKTLLWSKDRPRFDLWLCWGCRFLEHMIGSKHWHGCIHPSSLADRSKNTSTAGKIFILRNGDLQIWVEYLLLKLKDGSSLYINASL